MGVGQRSALGYNTTPDLEGKRFGRLLVASMVLPKTRRIYWHCWCACGSSLKTQTSNLTSGHTQSCGCLRTEMARETPHRRMEQALRLRHSSRGMTRGEWEALLIRQQYLCALCGKPETKIDNRTGRVRSLSLDHCHSTGKNRAALCSFCNHGLGNFFDNPDLLSQAAEYVRRFRNE